jgi:hypothetical protein
MADDNSISILLQIPQIAVVTAAEILVSISGLELSYSQVTFIQLRIACSLGLHSGGTVNEVSGASRLAVDRLVRRSDHSISHRIHFI